MNEMQIVCACLLTKLTNYSLVPFAKQLQTSRIPPCRICTALSPLLNGLAHILVVAQARAILVAIIWATSVGSNRTAHIDNVRTVIARWVETVVGEAIVQVDLRAVWGEAGGRALAWKQGEGWCDEPKKTVKRFR
jgi:hypothetical protein